MELMCSAARGVVVPVALSLSTSPSPSPSLSHVRRKPNTPPCTLVSSSSFSLAHFPTSSDFGTRPHSWRRCNHARRRWIVQRVVATTDSTSSALKEKARRISPDLKGTSIFLIGMMGSGKSTVGRTLAESLGYFFFDSDVVVEQAAGGASVAQIFKENGEEEFRDIETSVIAELSSMGRLVVATGGGAVIRRNNWSYMRHGVTVFLHAPLETLANRVVTAGTGSRPLLSQEVDEVQIEGATYEETLAKISSLWGARKEMYASADITITLEEIALNQGVKVDQIIPENVAIEILGRLENMVELRKKKDRTLMQQL